MTMWETAKQLFESLKSVAFALAPGLKNLGADVKAEVERLGTQGSMEAASGLFTGHGFVPYGPGQYTRSTGEHEMEYASALFNGDGSVPYDRAHTPSMEHQQEMERER
jgi:hypothetical protein